MEGGVDVVGAGSGLCLHACVLFSARKFKPAGTSVGNERAQDDCLLCVCDCHLVNVRFFTHIQNFVSVICW